jgi:serine/threonine-protein kinase
MTGTPIVKRPSIKVRQRIGKYRIEKCLSDGAFAAVYRAMDTIEGVRVALKIPHPHLMDKQFFEDFRKEVRMAARMDHDNILKLKNASFIDHHFVIVFPLGEESLEERMQRRLAMKTAITIAEQILEAVAHAHHHKIIHCDIKPGNILLFPNNRVRLADFGISRIAHRTIEASGSGTVGYMAPEQAMGKPSVRSDVFALGLLLYRMFSGALPQWPFEWPPPGMDRLKKKLHPEMIRLLQKSLSVKPAGRFANAEAMLKEFKRIKARALSYSTQARRRPSRTEQSNLAWQDVRRREFMRLYGKALEAHYSCSRCQGPISERMQACPWCGKSQSKLPEETRFPRACPRCHRGMKLDWKYCPSCYGAGFSDYSFREYSDKRYVGRCANSSCDRKVLMPFIKYCPWCRRSVKRKWKIAGSQETCHRCGWGVLSAFWQTCPWCKAELKQRPKRISK